MSNVVSLQERQFAARICDILYSAYESLDEAKIARASVLATKAVEVGVTADEIAEVERALMSM